MPKKLQINDTDQDLLIEDIRKIIFGEKNTCILYELDKNEEIQEKILNLIPSLRNKFLIHNIPGVQRPETLKRPWLSIMRSFLKRKYSIISENYIIKTDNGNIPTKRYILLSNELLS